MEVWTGQNVFGKLEFGLAVKAAGDSWSVVHVHSNMWSFLHTYAFTVQMII